MRIGSISENKEIEKRISITPDIAKKYVTNGFQILLEAGYGSHLGILDDKFLNEGCKIEKKENILNQSDVVLQLNLPEEKNLEFFQENKLLIGSFNSSQNLEKITLELIMPSNEDIDLLNYIAFVLANVIAMKIL